jgi:hypothetical protein
MDRGVRSRRIADVDLVRRGIILAPWITADAHSTNATSQSPPRNLMTSRYAAEHGHTTEDVRATRACVM